MNKDTTCVGLDVHKNQHTVAMMLPETETPRVWSIKNDAKEIKRMVRKIKKQAPGQVKYCYEAGVCGFALQRIIESAGAECIVAAPSLIPIMPGQRVRTDKRDAEKLARLLRSDFLTSVQPPNEADESVRDICRMREAAMRDLNRIRHQLGKFLLRRGFVYHDGRNWTEKHQRWIRGIKFGNLLDDENLTNYLLELEHRSDRLKNLDERIEEISQTAPYKVPADYLRCFRGIKTTTAMTILTELYSFERFESPRKLMGFLGLTPSEDSSGLSIRKGGITKSGNSRVRRILIEASWHQRGRPLTSAALAKRREGQPDWVIAKAKHCQKRLHDRYFHFMYKSCKSPTVVVTAVAREFAGFLWHVLHQHRLEEIGVGALPFVECQ